MNRSKVRRNSRRNHRGVLPGPPAVALALVSLLPGLSHCSQPRQVSFNQDIRPLLNQRCVVCHGGVKREAGFSLLFRSEAVGKAESGKRILVPGNPGESELIRRVRHSDPGERMPLKAEPLSQDEIGMLEAWIAEGAGWEEHWAYVPPDPVVLPGVKDAGWPRNGIDYFILSRIEEEGMTPNPEADCPRLARRVSLDLTGLPVAPGDVDRLCSDFSDQAYEDFVEKLLNSPRFGERWAAMWLDLARYADTQGYEKDPERTIWKYRDWVIEAFNADKPFDQFTVEQLAGDLLPSPSQDQLIATAFNRNTMTNTEGGTRDEEFRIAAVIDRVNTTMEVWQGTTMQCTQCHGHPYDPFKHGEYYQLFAFFNNTEDSDHPDEWPTLPTFSDLGSRERGLRILDRIRDLETQIEEQAQSAESQRKLDEWMESAREQLKSSEGRTLVGLKKIRSESEIERIIKGSDHTPMDPFDRRQILEFYVAIAPEFAPLQERLKQQRALLETLDPVRTPIMRELPAGHRRTTRVFERGNWLTPGSRVEAGIPKALGTFPESMPRNRLGLARWLVAEENPLTGRVAVNRFWHEIFGTGLVETLEDFGTRGSRPSHPELLDWLSLEFTRSCRWSVKSLLKILVTSATYRQSSRSNPEKLEKDPYNRLLARAPRFRLTAEQIRDQALAVGGLLSAQMLGPSVMPPQPPGIWNSPYGSSDKWETSPGQDKYRRGIYTFWKRTSPYPSMEAFDKTSHEVVVSRRIPTNTPLQALVTLNDPVYVEAAVGLARRMLEEVNGDVEARLRWGYRLAFGQEPDRSTLEDLASLHKGAYQVYTRQSRATDQLLRTAALKSGDPSADWAAFATVAGAILNLDDFLTRN